MEGVELAKENESVRSCVMSAQQLYERFEKLPLEKRKILAEWAKGASGDAAPLLVLPKGMDDAGGGEIQPETTPGTPEASAKEETIEETQQQQVAPQEAVEEVVSKEESPVVVKEQKKDPVKEIKTNEDIKVKETPKDVPVKEVKKETKPEEEKEGQ